MIQAGILSEGILKLFHLKALSEGDKYGYEIGKYIDAKSEVIIGLNSLHYTAVLKGWKIKSL
jgi:DNA-binding PadR family transcriptional regulator